MMLSRNRMMLSGNRMMLSGNRMIQRPVQTGFRLSRKAAGPSCASAL
jgi:hypothetical protein